MKKYLMSGIAAFAFCAAFTSCSKSDLYDQSAVDERNQQELLEKENAVIASYEAAFEKAFGQVGANVDWGFGTRSNTRAEGYEVGARPEANMWTSWGFLAPDPLTTSQKLRAQYYFQMNNITNPNRPNYGTRDFFMQQVYDGGTDPMAGKSLEKYLAADNSTYIESGEHMDHLTCGPDHTHTNNFNNGTCSTNDHVADRDQTDVNDTDKQHSDEIMLMLNTKTSCFGYANSDASCVRDDRWTLVSAKTIDDFCDGDSGFAAWLADRLPAGEEDKKCDDDFHRDFIGFDFDQLPDENCYAFNGGYDKDGNRTYDNNQIVRKEFVYAQYGSLSEASNQLVYNLDGTISTYSSWDEYLMVDGFKIPYVSADANQYCALGENANIGIGGMDNMNDYEKFGDYSATGENDNTPYLKNLPGYQSDLKAINMKFITKMVRDGYRPIKDKQLMRWVKIGGCNDGYFSDWIVTFMPADSGDTPEIHYYRVIAEDLTADEASDFDFNDVVFDIIPNDAKNGAKIVLRAAGGIYKLTVAGQEVHDAFAAAYPDAGYGLGANGLYPMINTNPWNPEVKVTLFENYAGDFSDAQIRNTIKDILIKVYKPGFEENGIPLGATTGKAACKILVDDTFEVVPERFGIADKYNDFTTYVQGYFANEFWWKRGAAPQTGN